MTLHPLSNPHDATSTTDVDDSSREAAGDSFSKFKTVASRLEALYGTGDNPQLRRKFYQRIQRCSIEHGPDCYEVVRACVEAAATADYPDKYFCRAVSAELKSLAYWDIPTGF